MTRAFDFTVVAVIYAVAVVIHLMGVELMAPGTPLYSLATDGTASMNGQARADLWFQIISVWVPMIGFLGITAWAMVREYKRQAVTSIQGQQPF
jgi:hypothetical protein